MIPTKWHRKIFLIDGMGAITSAVFLGLVLPMLKTGLHDDVLRNLSLAAVVFAIYSFGCHLSNKSRSKGALKIILFANISYAVVSIAVFLNFYQEISLLGKIYFIIEIFLLFIIVWVEKHILQGLYNYEAYQKAKDSKS